MKKILCVIMACVLLVVGIGLFKGEKAIIIYSSMEQFRNDELQKQLNEEFPESNIFVMYVPTAELAKHLEEEESNTAADIVVGLERAYMDKLQYVLADISQYSHLEYLDTMRPGTNKYVIWERQAGSIIVNKTVLEKRKLPMPKTYEDLLKPEYQNMIAMPNPRNSSTGYFFLKNLTNAMGEGKAFAYLDVLAFNIKQFTESGAGTVDLLVKGEVAIGLGLTFQGVNELNKGSDFVILEPEFGSPYSLTATSMILGRENDPDIEAVFEFIVNDYMVYDKMYSSPEKVLKNQVNGVKNYPENVRYGNMTGIDDFEEKEKLLAKWKY